MSIWLTKLINHDYLTIFFPYSKQWEGKSMEQNPKKRSIKTRNIEITFSIQLEMLSKLNVIVSVQSIVRKRGREEGGGQVEHYPPPGLGLSPLPGPCVQGYSYTWNWKRSQDKLRLDIIYKTSPCHYLTKKKENEQTSMTHHLSFHPKINPFCTKTL